MFRTTGRVDSADATPTRWESSHPPSLHLSPPHPPPFVLFSFGLRQTPQTSNPTLSLAPLRRRRVSKEAHPAVPAAAFSLGRLSSGEIVLLCEVVTVFYLATSHFIRSPRPVLSTSCPFPTRLSCPREEPTRRSLSQPRLARKPPSPVAPLKVNH